MVDSLLVGRKGHLVKPTISEKHPFGGAFAHWRVVWPGLPLCGVVWCGEIWCDLCLRLLV